jgi:AcrR family transcriptional regulator
LETVVDAAADVVEREGFAGLTMRKVAARLGVGVMTLYGYVRTREELVAAMIDRYLAELAVPHVEHLEWQEQVAEVFRSVNHAFEAHPILSELVGHQSLDGLAFYSGAELALRALQRAGLGESDVVGALDALTSFVTGFAQRKAERRLRATQSAERLVRIRQLPKTEFRALHELAPALVMWDSERHFEEGLRIVLDGIAQRIPSEREA